MQIHRLLAKCERLQFSIDAISQQLLDAKTAEAAATQKASALIRDNESLQLEIQQLRAEVARAQASSTDSASSSSTVYVLDRFQLSKDAFSSDFDFCDDSVREKGWRCRKHGTQVM